MKKLKLMILGGTQYIIPVIRKAQQLGIYVITADYLPDNIAHKYSDEYCNVSVIDKEAVLKVAKEKQINGIMSFACDAGVVAAAYVSEKLNLHFQCPYESALILQDKGRFRKFLLDNEFNSPHAKRYTDGEQPFSDLEYFTWPVIVKPVDCAGSKGVTKVEKVEDLARAIKVAQNSAHGGAFIIEDFLTFEGYHSSTDPFSIDGKFVYKTFSDQLFDKDAVNPYAPSLIIWPSSMKKENQDYLHSELQRLMDLLKVKDGIYNIETCVGKGNVPYIMEVSPRGGGCKIAELQEKALGLPCIENEIRSAVGMPLVPFHEKAIDGHWCIMVLHAKPGESGIFKGLDILPEIKDNNVEYLNVTIKEGDFLHPFGGGSDAIGEIFLHTDTREELDDLLEHIWDWLTIQLI